MGDYAVAIGLAGTLFFSVPVGEARSKVVLNLAITMIPFVLLARVVGPLLDRFPHGRRYALATTMLTRAFFCYVIAGHMNDVALYPAAFGVLVMSKAYSVARSAATPRLLPAQITPVAANSRLSLASNVAGALSAGAALLVAKLAPTGPLWIALACFLVGMILSLRLPEHTDSDRTARVPRSGTMRQVLLGRRQLDRGVAIGLRPTAALRGLSGFLTLYLAFLLRSGHQSVSGHVALGVVAVAAGAGSFLGNGIGARLRLRTPHPLQLGLLITAVAACILAALRYNLATAAVVAGVAGIANGLCKLCLDAVIQQDVDETIRSSVFARSETVLQLAWVLGGAIGLIPFGGWGGFALVAALLAGVAVWTGPALPSLCRQTTPAQSSPAFQQEN